MATNVTDKINSATSPRSTTPTRGKRPPRSSPSASTSLRSVRQWSRADHWVDQLELVFEGLIEQRDAMIAHRKAVTKAARSTRAVACSSCGSRRTCSVSVPAARWQRRAASSPSPASSRQSSERTRDASTLRIVWCAQRSTSRCLHNPTLSKEQHHDNRNQTRGQIVAADVSALLRARNPLIWIVTREEARVERLVVEAAAAAGYCPRTWDVAQGITDISGEQIAEMRELKTPALRSR